MKHKTSITVTTEWFKNPYNTEERLFKRLCSALIHNMSLDDLRKIFTLIKNDPTTPEIRALISAPDTDENIREHLIYLKDLEVIGYEAEINL